METVTQKGWSVSVQTSSSYDGAILYVFRMVGNKIFKGSYYEKWFASREDAWQFAYIHGYTQRYFRRSWCDCCKEVHSFLKRECPNRFKPIDFSELEDLD